MQHLIDRIQEMDGTEIEQRASSWTVRLNAPVVFRTEVVIVPDVLEW